MGYQLRLYTLKTHSTFLMKNEILLLKNLRFVKRLNRHRSLSTPCHRPIDFPILTSFPSVTYHLPFNDDLALGKARIRREPNLGCRSADRTWWRDALPKSLHESCRLGRRILVMKMICSHGHCECGGHAVRKLSTASHCRLTRPTREWLFTDAQ